MTNELQQLPDLVILNIFSYLDLADLCKVGRVCKKWHELSRHPNFWKCVKIDISKYTYVKRLFPQLSPYVKHIYFHHLFPSIFSVPELMIELAARCPTLEQLTVEGAGMLHPLEERLAPSKQQGEVRKHPLLEHLKVLSIRYSILDTQSFLAEFAALLPPELLVLDLSSCYFPELPNLCSQLSFLQELYIPYNDTSIYFSIPDFKFLKYLKNLKVLDLEGQHFKVDQLIETLRENIFLEKLYLKNCEGVCDLSLINIIRHNLFTHLTEICIRNTSITPEGVSALISSCNSLKTLGIDPLQFNECYEMLMYQELLFLDSSNAMICDHFMKNHTHDCLVSKASF